MRIGFIGAGNMANSLIRGLLAKRITPSNILASDIDTEKLTLLQTECGVTLADNKTIAEQADVVILAVKPQAMYTVCQELGQAAASNQALYLSIAAGITIAHLEKWLGPHIPIVRCMPNTPALVGKGATALVANPRVSAEQTTLAGDILSAVGLSLWLDDESAIDAVTALSGSGPAYFFLLMETMQDVARDMGLAPEVAKVLTYQTALGAAELALKSELGTAELRRQVTSPGGTTEQAINQFETGGFRALVSKALMAAHKRSQELAEAFGEK